MNSIAENLLCFGRGDRGRSSSRYRSGRLHDRANLFELRAAFLTFGCGSAAIANGDAEKKRAAHGLRGRSFGLVRLLEKRQGAETVGTGFRVQGHTASLLQRDGSDQGLLFFFVVLSEFVARFANGSSNDLPSEAVALLVSKATFAWA